MIKQLVICLVISFFFAWAESNLSQRFPERQKHDIRSIGSVLCPWENYSRGRHRKMLYSLPWDRILRTRPLFSHSFFVSYLSYSLSLRKTSFPLSLFWREKRHDLLISEQITNDSPSLLKSGDRSRVPLVYQLKCYIIHFRVIDNKKKKLPRRLLQKPVWDTFWTF